MKRYSLILGLILLAFSSWAQVKSNVANEKKVNIYLAGTSHARIDFGIKKLSEMLRQNGFEVTMLPKRAKMPPVGKVKTIFIGIATEGLIKMLLKDLSDVPGKSPGKE